MGNPLIQYTRTNRSRENTQTTAVEKGFVKIKPPFLIKNSEWKKTNLHLHNTRKYISWPRKLYGKITKWRNDKKKKIPLNSGFPIKCLMKRNILSVTTITLVDFGGMSQWN